MNEVQIDYSPKGFLKTFSLLFAGYSVLFGLYLSIKQALISNYSIIFYCSLILIVLAIVVILYFTLWKPKPIITITNESFNSNISGQKEVLIAWNEIIEVKIGISSLIFVLKDKKPINIDLNTLQYNDLKQIKTRIIELCELNRISFKNI